MVLQNLSPHKIAQEITHQVSIQPRGNEHFLFYQGNLILACFPWFYHNSQVQIHEIFLHLFYQLFIHYFQIINFHL